MLSKNGQLAGVEQNLECVRFTYNEATNVNMTVTGSASHMRGSECCSHEQLVLGTDQWV